MLSEHRCLYKTQVSGIEYSNKPRWSSQDWATGRERLILAFKTIPFVFDVNVLSIKLNAPFATSIVVFQFAA